jgi:hypothetical protein
MSLPNFDAFRTHMLNVPREIGRTLNEYGAWRPVLTLDCRGSLYVVAVAGLLTNREGWLAVAAGKLPELLVEREARFYALVTPACWVMNGDTPAEETLIVHLARAGHSETWVATIERGNGKVTLGQWQQRETVDSLGLGPLDAAVGAVV